MDAPSGPRTDPGSDAPRNAVGPARTTDDPRTGPLLIGPMNFADVLDGAFTLYRANARTLVTVAAVILLPVQLLVAWLGRDLLSDGAANFFNDPTTGGVSFDEGSSVAAVLVGLASMALVVPFVCGVASRVASASYFGGRLGPGDALRAVRGRWWSFVVAWILVHMAEAVGGLLMFFPGLLVMALFVAVAPAIAIEGLRPVAAMRRSAQLLRPRLFPVLGIALGSAVVVTAVEFALGWLPEVLAGVTGGWAWLFVAAGAVVTNVVTTPYVALVATLVYFDARIRSEGMDVALVAGRLTRPT